MLLLAIAAEIAKNSLKKLSCDAIILGCTELPEVYNEQNLGMRVVDTTRLLAHKALEYAKCQSKPLHEQKSSLHATLYTSV